MQELIDRIRRPASRPVDARVARPRSLGDTIPTPLALVVLGAWLLGLTWLFAISPEPDPDAAVSLVDELIASAMLASWVGAFVGLGLRRRFGLTVTIAGGLLLAGAGVLCGLTGHTGLWIPTQIGVGLGLAALATISSRLTG